jgi:hypothetical protein
VGAATGQNMSFQMPRGCAIVAPLLPDRLEERVSSGWSLGASFPIHQEAQRADILWSCAFRASSLKGPFLRSICFFPWTLRSSAAGAILFFSNPSHAGRMLR